MTRQQLIDAQQIFWPGSRILTVGGFLNECGAHDRIAECIGDCPARYLERVTSYVVELGNDIVFYETPAPWRHLGVRYGAEGWQYISGFPVTKVSRG